MSWNKKLLSFVSVTFLITSYISTTQMQAAPPRSAPLANALQFNVSARIIVLKNGKPDKDLPPQTIAAGVAVKGQNARVETESRSKPVVFLVSPTSLTKLLPSQKAGIRWKIDSRSWTSGATSSTRLTVQSLMSDPSAVRASLVKSGARKTGSGRLNGTLVDIYSATKFGGKSQKLTAWLRRSDALPLRVQTLSPTLSSTLSWTNYRRANLSESFFRAPAGYSLREGTGQPYL
jgi:hypothetical protein